MVKNSQLQRRNRRPIGVDLFAGAGGLSLGFEEAGFDIVAAIDIDPIHCATHEFNFPECAVISRSVTTLSGTEIRRLADIGDMPIDVVFGGAPCQGFSTIGKRALDDPRNRLVFDFVRLVDELEAAYFVFENVRGLTFGAHRQFLEELIDEFNTRGYSVLLPYRVLNAADYGVPQVRKRLFLMGCKKGLRMPSYPPPTVVPANIELRDIELPRGPTVWDAIGDLPEVEHIADLMRTDEVHANFAPPSAYARELRNAPGQDDFSYERLSDRSLLTSSMRSSHNALSRSRFAGTDFGQIEPVSRFLKLDPHGLCNTLRAGTGSERGAFTSPRPVHPFTPRCITVREAARLHSYPDWFRFHVTKWHGFRQIGNSVPPFLGRAVARNALHAIGLEAARPTESLVLGDRSLLALGMSSAAKRYGVANEELPRRTRQPEAVEEPGAQYVV